jgi:hypothetical protein
VFDVSGFMNGFVTSVCLTSIVLLMNKILQILVLVALGVGFVHKQNCASTVCWSHQSATNGHHSISTRNRARRGFGVWPKHLQFQSVS